jgi:DNA-binding YbaB/EbfC family protein
MDIMALMRQAQEFKKNLEQAQADLEQMTITGSAAGGMVTADVSGTGAVRRVKLDRSVVNPDDLEMLEDLIVVAIGDAQRRAADEAKARTGALGAGMNLPFKLPF